MKKIRLLAGVIVFSIATCAFCEQNVQTLLEGYFSNDLTLQNLNLEVQKQLLSQKSAYISNGWNFKISTGNVTVFTGDQCYATLKPDASLSFPQYNGLKVSVSSDIQIGGEKAGVSNTSIGLSADIISTKNASAKITLLKSDRALLETQRQLQNRFLSAEKEFYSSLKNLYSLSTEINRAEKSLYEDKINFDLVKAQGYGASSPKYRNAQMSVLSDQHNVDSAKHKLEREVKIFAALCGVEYQEEDARNFLPTEIPVVEAVDILSFSEEDFSQIESAYWNSCMNQLTRDSKKDITLSANTSYTFANSQTKSDTLNVGTSFTWNNTGLTANAGVSIPTTGTSHSPVCTFGISVDPNALSQAKISSEQEELAIQQEDIDMKKARASYQTAVKTRQASLADLEWNKSTYSENYQMYVTQAKDLQNWYKRGVITESEWRSAEVNKENYRIQMLMNSIDFIIYNDETTLLFNRDEELIGGEK